MIEKPTTGVVAGAAPAQEPSISTLFAHLKVSNFDDAIKSINGLRERVKFTEDYETLRLAATSAGAAPLKAADLLIAKCRSFVVTRTTSGWAERLVKEIDAYQAERLAAHGAGRPQE